MRYIHKFKKIYFVRRWRHILCATNWSDSIFLNQRSSHITGPKPGHCNAQRSPADQEVPCLQQTTPNK